jgi:quercetin dioxygenase-like cupin family protein
VPIEIRRFGVGHRRAVGPPGSVGLTGQVLHSDGRGTVTEVALARDARIEPHSSPNTTWFIVVEGGGWVGVDEEWTRIAAGEAALWPADVPHTAWTEHSEMRAIVVELAGADDRDTVIGRAAEADRAVPVERGIGRLAARTGTVDGANPSDGEPV